MWAGTVSTGALISRTATSATACGYTLKSTVL
jgi:hypothetical protein